MTRTTAVFEWLNILYMRHRYGDDIHTLRLGFGTEHFVLNAMIFVGKSSSLTR